MTLRQFHVLALACGHEKHPLLQRQALEPLQWRFHVLDVMQFHAHSLPCQVLHSKQALCSSLSCKSYVPRGTTQSLSARVQKLRRTSSARTTGDAASDVRELSEEVEAMRKLLNCNVCHERQKSVIITKCCHVFCERCIKRNLEARNRKCPGCGTGFGQADVKQFFFT